MKLSKRDYVALSGFRETLRRFLRTTEAGARAAGVTPAQHQLLLAVRGRPDRDWATARELAGVLGVRHHSVVGLLDRCEKRGLVRRLPSHEDRRVVEVYLTSEGLRLLEKVAASNRNELVALRQALNLAALGS